MQPRMVYTSLLMLIIIGSALGHGEEFKEKPSKRHLRELSNIRALMAKGMRRLLIAAEEFVIKTEEERWLGAKLLEVMFPDQEILTEHFDPYPIWPRCELLYSYIMVTPKENLMDMHVKFLKLQHDVREQLGVFL